MNKTFILVIEDFLKQNGFNDVQIMLRGCKSIVISNKSLVPYKSWGTWEYSKEWTVNLADSITDGIWQYAIWASSYSL